MQIIDMILGRFDIRKLKSICNEMHCGYRPDKRVEIYQYDMKKGKKVFATLYVCNTHLKDATALIHDIKESNPKLIIDKEVSELK